MLPYILVLIPSVLLLYAAEYVEAQRRGRCVAIIFLTFGLMLPCFLAGARDVGVGLDTAGYGIQVFNAANQGSSFSTYLSEIEKLHWDIGVLFSLVSYLAVYATHSLFWYFFVLQFFMLVPFYFAARIATRNRFVWLAVLVYYILLFFVDLSSLRQNIAISFIALAFILFVRKRQFMAIFFYVIAVGFHSSALVWAVLPGLWCLLFRRTPTGWEERRHAAPITWVVVSAVVFIVLNIDAVFRLLTSVPLLSRYASYLITDTSSSFILFYFCFGAMFVGLSFLFQRLSGEDRPIGRYFLLVAFLTFPLWYLQSFNRQFTRLVFYIWIFYPIILSFFLSKISKGASTEMPLEPEVLLYFAGALCYCGWVYVVNNSFGTFPYLSRLVGVA